MTFVGSLRRFGRIRKGSLGGSILYSFSQHLLSPALPLTHQRSPTCPCEAPIYSSKLHLLLSNPKTSVCLPQLFQIRYMLGNLFCETIIINIIPINVFEKIFFGITVLHTIFQRIETNRLCGSLAHVTFLSFKKTCQVLRKFLVLIVGFK